MRGIPTSVAMAALFILAAGLFLFGLPSEAWATPFDSAEQKIVQLRMTLTRIFYVVAAIAVIGSALMALGGRWPWSKFFVIAAAVFVVVVISQIMQFLGAPG